MHDFRRRDAHTLCARCQRSVVIIARVIKQNVISNRSLVFIQFNPHAHVVAVAVTLVHLFVDQVRLKHLQRDTEAQELTLYDTEEDLTITGEA